jgi:hypothetical protein
MWAPVMPGVMPLRSNEEMTHEEITSELEFEVQDAWELGICTCCPNSYLLLLTDGQYLYLDSWTLTPFAEAETFPKRNLRMTVDPHNKVVLSVHMEGSTVPKRAELLDRIAESELAGSEYSLMNGNDLPILWRQSLNAA